MTNNHPQDGTRQDCPAKGSDGFIYIFRVSLSYIGSRTKSPLSITIADTQVPAAVGQDGKTYFSPKAICEGLGIDWKTQHEKIKADPVLSSTVKEILMVAQDGKQRVMTMLPKEMAPGWLFTIKKVAPEVQAIPLNRPCRSINKN